jgi:hypothetical protein
VRVEHLDLTEERVLDDDTRGGLSDEPVAAGDVERGPVQRVRQDARADDREAREEGEACAERAAARRRVSVYQYDKPQPNAPVEVLGVRQPPREPRADERVVRGDPELLERDDVVVGLL